MTQYPATNDRAALIHHPASSVSRPKSGGYFIGASGLFYSFSSIKNIVLNKTYGDLINMPIRRQLESMRLLHEFEHGTSPTQLPVSFATDADLPKRWLSGWD